MSAYRNSDDVVDNIVIDFFFAVIYLIDMCLPLSYINANWNSTIFFLINKFFFIGKWREKFKNV